MAKKNKVEIDVVVDDKGSTKKVGVEAKKAASGLDQVDQSSRNAQKGIKGVAGTASAGGKNFAGMSRGMGGLVGAYASFAAQMFALTAAFGFFKRAGDLSVMQQGQLAYASATGIAMKSLAKDITAATGAQITFRDASQAAAIGTAAGLSTDQLTRLGTAAKDASAVLGRDVTDAFNRLVRGVTKAEPELLDELGIILRLDTASENYARTLGLVAQDLTQFQKSQAVANEVLSQAETKYSAILAVTGGGAVNQFAKLGKSMDDVVMTIQNTLLPVANVLAKVLGETPALAAAGFAMLASGPLKAMGFSLKDTALAQKKAAAESVASYAKRKMDILETTKAIDLEKAAIQQKANATLKAEGYTGNSKVLKNVAATGIITPQARASIKKGLKAVNLDVKESTVIQKGMFKGLTVGVVKDYEAMVMRLDVLEKAKAAGTVTNVQRMKLAWQGLTTSIARGGAALTAFASKALAAFGWVSIAITIFLALKEAMSVDAVMTDLELALDRQKTKVKELNEEYEHFLAIQRVMAKEGTGAQGIAGLAATGNLVGSLNVAQTELLFRQYRAYAEKTGFLLENAKADLAAAQASFQLDLTKEQNEVERLSGVSGYGTLARKGADMLGISSIFYGDDGDAVTDAQENANKFVQLQIASINDVVKKFGSNKVFEDYRDLLMSPDEVDAKALAKAKSNVDELTNVYQGFAKNLKAAADSTKSVYNSLAPKNAFESAILDQQKIIRESIKARSATDADSTMFGYATDQEAAAKKEILRLTTINEATLKRVLLLNKANVLLKEASAIEIPTFRKKAVAMATENVAQQKRLNKENEIFILKNLIITADGVATTAQANKLKSLRSELSLLKVAEKTAETKLTLTNAQFELELKIAELKFGQYTTQGEKKMLDFERQGLDIAQRRLVIQSKLSKQKVDDAMKVGAGAGGLLQTPGKQRAEAELAVARTMQKEKLRLISAEFDLKEKQAILDNKLTMDKWNLLDSEYALREIDQTIIRDKYRLLAAQQSAAANAADVIMNDGTRVETTDSYALRQSSDTSTNMANAAGSQVTALTTLRTTLASILALQPDQNQDLIKLIGEEKVEALRQAGVELDNLATKVSDLQPMEVLLKDLGSSVHDNMNSAFTAMVTGAKSAKDAFADMAVSILKDLAAMIVKMAILQMFKGTGFGNFMGLGARNGGVFDQGKKMSYATGGVAKGSTSGYPVMMHGTEAVVPLPNGKSIPVEMSGKGGGGGTNNIVVNISTDGQSSKQGSTGPDMDKLGGAVAAAVQVELQNQKRSGGILNPYGAA